MIRFTEDWLESTGRTRSGKLAKPRKKKPADGIPDITASKTVKAPGLKQLLSLEQELAPSPHARQLIKLERNEKYAKKKGPEHKAQVIFFDLMWRKHRDIYRLLHATPNGGVRDEVTGFEMKAEGQKSGFPDVTLNAARGVYHGLHMELKVGKNTMSESQKEWQALLLSEGYAAVEVRGWEEMVSVTLRYWALSTGETL
ncbi:VRR-NUC domain-containing protein [Enterobacter soli]|uniref:VRR-NUC domain-containing protein n=1 Tax=Enterobacter soli TaxID=885040 RepID=UPI002F3E94CA